MTKQIINVGTSVNDRSGDSIRSAFQKVNANFTELYTALGLNSDGTLNLGAFEFAGSTLSTTDSTPIIIDQATTITSDLTVGGNILPQIAINSELGSSSMPWGDLYVNLRNSTGASGIVQYKSNTKEMSYSLTATLNTLKINYGIQEQVQSISNASGVVVHDCTSGQIFYHSSPVSNWTVNLTNLGVSDFAFTNIKLFIDQGGTGYYPDALQVNGVSQTIRWQGNTTPSVSTNRIDAVQFSLIYSGATNYLVFGQIVGF
jgi:hypothetical protein